MASRRVNPGLSLTCRFVCVFLLLLSNFPNYSQTELKPKKPIKDFGKSLKKYDKKLEKTDDKAKKAGASDDEVIRVQTNMVVTDVLVVNQKGNALVGLGKDDFIVTENDVPQELELFSLGKNASIPKTIVLILDYSGSMRPYISNSIEAAKILVDKLAPTDRLALVTDDIEIEVEFTSDKAKLKSKLDSLRSKTLGRKPGKSEQYSALLATLKEMFDEEDIRPIIIFQADGDEFPILKPIDPKWSRFYRERKFSFADITDAVERSRATIYSVIPGVRFFGLPSEELLARGAQVSSSMWGKPPRPDTAKMDEQARKVAAAVAQDQYKRQASMFEVARISGGYTSFLESIEGAAAIYDSIFKVIENRYVVGYYPKNEARDGTRRNVKIEVKGHPEYVVLGRKTYFAPEQ